MRHIAIVRVYYRYLRIVLRRVLWSRRIGAGNGMYRTLGPTSFHVCSYRNIELVGNSISTTDAGYTYYGRAVTAA